MTIRITPIRALESNYIWMIHNDRFAVLVDPGSAEVAKAALHSHELSLTGILVTHHHHDHIGGIEGLLADKPVPVWAPDDQRIPHTTDVVRDGDQITLPELPLSFTVIHTPGHTLSHVAYVNETMLFAGDTLFSLGCGRLFEGTPAQMLASLDRLSRAHPEALLYCGHEYTAANGQFAMEVEPNNPDLHKRLKVVQALRVQDKPTLPVTLGEELATNPFLRTREPAVMLAARQHDSQCGDTATEVFATLRAWKDHS